MYAYDGAVSAKRAKGVKKSVLQASITFDDYKRCLFEEEVLSRPMTTLRSDHHHIYGQTTQKKALSPFDSKRYIKPDGVQTLAYGHHAIPPPS